MLSRAYYTTRKIGFPTSFPARATGDSYIRTIGVIIYCMSMGSGSKRNWRRDADHGIIRRNGVTMDRSDATVTKNSCERNE